MMYNPKSILDANAGIIESTMKLQAIAEKGNWKDDELKQIIEKLTTITGIIALTVERELAPR